MTGPIERALSRATENRSTTPSQSNPLETNPTPLVPEDIALPTSASAVVSQPSRRSVHVNTLGQRFSATTWMVAHSEANGPKHIASKCVRQFPEFFPGNAKAQLQKSSRWWQQRDRTLALKVNGIRKGNFAMSSTRRAKRFNLKATAGRGRKRSTWAQALYDQLRVDFEALRAAGVKFTTSILRQHALHLIQTADESSPYYRTLIVQARPIDSRITTRWVQHFMMSNRIVLRSQTGKLLVSPAKQLFIDKYVAFHLGELQRAFTSGDLKEEDVENADETHFVFNMDTGKTLGFIGDNHVKYADVVSGGEPITMMVRISGGPVAMIHPPMLVFKNQSSSYPIRGVPDNVPGVCYRSGPKGWMDASVWRAWLNESRAINRLPSNRERVLFVDNCSSHVTNDDVQVSLNNIRTSLRKLPANATNIVQPADSFVIQKIKDAWRKRWDNYKYGLITQGLWQDGIDGSGSGKLQNPGKAFFLQLAADSVKEVNNQKDSSGISYARKAMVMTGLSLGLNGAWSESQLTSDLQAIIAQHRNHFDGQPVSAADVETESDDE